VNKFVGSIVLFLLVSSISKLFHAVFMAELGYFL